MHKQLSISDYVRLLFPQRIAKGKQHRTQIDKALELSKVDPQLARDMVHSGSGKKDAIKISQQSGISAISLKPSQTTMRAEHTVGIAINMLIAKKIGGNIGAIISKDGHIMDGHHRWAGSILAGGAQATVGGWVAQLRGKKLIPVLNIITKGYFGRRNGNKGTGDISKIVPSEVKKILQDYEDNGRSGEYGFTAQEFKKALQDRFGSVSQGIEIISDNAKLINKKVPIWAPDRVDMPVIEPSEVPEAAELLNKGKVDWAEPFKK